MHAPVPVIIRCGLDAALIGADESRIGHEIVVVDTAQPILIVESVIGDRMRSVLAPAGTDDTGKQLGELRFTKTEAVR